MAHDLAKIELDGRDHGADDHNETESSARSSLSKSLRQQGTVHQRLPPQYSTTSFHWYFKCSGLCSAYMLFLVHAGAFCPYTQTTELDALSRILCALDCMHRKFRAVKTFMDTHLSMKINPSI